MLMNKPIWEGVYHSFSEVPVEGSGFDGDTWIAKSLARMEALKAETQQNAPLPPMGNYREALLPLLTALVYREKKSLRILDFGGGPGFAYYQTVCAAPEVENIEYHIVEREKVCQAGQEFFSTDFNKPVFHSELPQSKEGLFDIVHSSSALQYIDDWERLLLQLCALSRQYVLLVDVLAGNIPNFVAAQNYYESKIPSRFFNINHFLSVVLSCGYDLMFSSIYHPAILGAEQFLPMQNYEEAYQLKRACNLLFVKTVSADRKGGNEYPY